MKCPHLMNLLNFYCNATEKLYFPSHFQLSEYCTGTDHRKCPFIREQDLEYQFI